MTDSSPVLDSLRRTPSTLFSNPVLFVPVLLVLSFQVPQFALESIAPMASRIVSFGLPVVFAVVMPFFQGGLIGMADEALDGRTSLQTFIHDGKSNYVSILVAYLALLAVHFVLGMITFVVAIAGGASILQSGGLQSANPAVLAVSSILVAVVFLGYLLLVFFAQFYGQAIVLEDRGVVNGFKRSISVVRHHLVSTLGYSFIGVVAGGLAGIIFAVASIFLSLRSTTMFALPEPSRLMVLAMSLLVVAGGILFGGFATVYSVSFYRAISRSAGGTRA